MASCFPFAHLTRDVGSWLAIISASTLISDWVRSQKVGVDGTIDHIITLWLPGVTAHFLSLRWVCRADCWTDFRLVRRKMSFRIRLPVRRVPNRKLNCSSLNTLETRRDLSPEISRRLTIYKPQELSANRVEEHWSTFTGEVTEAVSEVRSYTKRKNKNWFDENNAEIHTQAVRGEEQGPWKLP